MLDDTDGLTTTAIAERIGVTRQRVDQLLHSGLLKMRIVHALEERLGKAAAAPIIEGLRGKSLDRFKAALRSATEHA